MSDMWITDDVTGEQFLWAGDTSALRAWLNSQFPDGDADVAAAIDEVVDGFARGVGGDPGLAFLGLIVTPKEEAEPWRRWPKTFTGFLDRAAAARLARMDEAGALTVSGELSEDVDLVRLAFVQRTRGYLAANQAACQANDAAAAALATYGTTARADSAGRRVIKHAFVEAWRRARQQWLEEREAVRTARRLDGRVLAGIRRAMGLDQAQLAAKLHVSTDTVRAWEQGRTLTNEGASADVWQLWEQWVADTQQIVDAAFIEGVVGLPGATPAAIIQAALLLHDGRVTIHPGEALQRM